MDWGEPAVRLAAALAAGVLIGIERGWSLRELVAGTRVAGLRTFALLSVVGGVAGLVTTTGAALVGGAIVGAGLLILVLGYSRSLRDRGDATSAVAALLTVGIGFLAGIDLVGIALAAAAATVLILAMREELHGLVDRLDAHDVKALARFAVIALAVLPFLPDRSMGPYGAWNPSKLWWVIILVTGFSFVGYVANRLFGERHGTIATAVIGGAYSSTAVTQALAQRLGRAEQPGAEPAGIALASATMYLRVLVLVAVLANRMLASFAMILAPALLVAGAAGWLLYRKAPAQADVSASHNPIALLPALAFVVFVGLAAIVVRWAEGRFGDGGIALLLFIMGALDVDTSIVTAGGLPAETIGSELAAIAIAGTIVANMSVKIATTLAFAKRRGRVPALALLASTAVLAGSLTAAWFRL